MARTNNTLGIRDYSWVSVAAYIDYVTRACKLSKLTSIEINSLRVGKRGGEYLLSRKRTTARLLSENMRAIEVFVGANESQLVEEELVVLRGVWNVTKSSLGVVEDHIVTLESVVQVPLLDMVEFDGASDEGVDDDIPF